MKTKPSSLKSNLSKDMKKQGHTGAKKPSNKKLDAEDSLAETPKKGQYREPSSKKLSGETSLQKSHKLVHLKEFNSFDSIQEEHRVAYKDVKGDEKVIEFELKKGETFEEAKKRLLGEFKMFWSHYKKDEEK